MRRRMIGLAVALVALALFGGGYVMGQADRPETAVAAGNEYCRARTETRYFDGGSYTLVSAVVAHWNDYSGHWESVFDYTARSRVGFSCND